jgi:drug/metabolite transporter (DMT)-like permease
LTLYVLANRLTTAANTIFLQSAAPLYLVFLSPLLLRENLNRKDLVFGCAVAIGMVFLVLSTPLTYATAPNPRLGNLLGAFAGVFWALTLLGLRWLSRESERDSSNEGTAAVAVGNLLAFAASLPFLFPLEPSSSTDWIVVTYLGVFQIAVAYVLLTRSMRRVGAVETSLLLLLEPVLNPLWAWLLHGERPGALTLLGGTIILVATVLKLCSDRES